MYHDIIMCVYVIDHIPDRMYNKMDGWHGM